jgi:glycosyltransferase involved in cell wall biosynthesis
MQSKLIQRGVPRTKVRYIPNFVDVDELKPVTKDNAFSRAHGLNGMFVVSYAGNMGYAQGLEVLVQAAYILRHDSNVLFLFVGDGVACASLLADVQQKQLTNVKFVGHQPYARVPEIYAASDLCAVTLLDTIAGDAIPSKLYRIMACARPTLAIASNDSDLASVVTESGGGIVAPPDAETIAATIRSYAGLSSVERKQYGDRGRKYVIAHVDRARITRQYSDLVNELARRSTPISTQIVTPPSSVS